MKHVKRVSKMLPPAVAGVPMKAVPVKVKPA